MDKIRLIGWAKYPAFEELDVPPVVAGARNWITPPDEIEDAFFPYP